MCAKRDHISNLNILSPMSCYRVAAESDRNLMKASNIGVCFGPTLMRPERESVASIVDIKYQNIIVEVMIQNVEQVSVLEWRCGVCVWGYGTGECVWGGGVWNR